MAGIADARKVSASAPEDSDRQTVMVRESGAEVILSLGACSFPAGLTPAQARLLGTQLVVAAEHVEANAAATAGAP